MGNVLSFRDGRTKRVINQIGRMYNKANNLTQEYYQLMLNDPDKGIEELPNFLRGVRKINPEPALESMAGGPNHDWTGPMLNIIGIVYPILKIENREKALVKCLDFLDGLRYDYSQNHVELINEPLLIRDIIISRTIYWPGYQIYIDQLDKNKTWKDFKPYLEKTKSEFFLAYAVTKHEHSSIEVRTKFYKTFPDLMIRTKQAIGGIIYDEAKRYHEKDKITIEKYIDDTIIKYDPLLHNDIRKSMLEEDWIKID